MKNILSSSIIILFVSTNTFAQSSEQFLESDILEQPLQLFIESVPTQTIESIIVNNGKDTLFLEPIKHGLFISFTEEYTLLNTINSMDSKQEENVLPPNYSFKTYGNKTTIVDSIDLNNDGVNEIFLAREMQSVMTPPNPGPYGVGVERKSFQQYEVWDVKTKRKIFEVQNMNAGNVAVSTNVMHSFGYRFKVDILKNGTIVLSDTQGGQTNIEMGKYVFDKKTGTYSKE